MNNYPYQPYRPYSRVPNTSTHNVNLAQYMDVLQKSRTNYSNRTLDLQPTQPYPKNLSNISTELEKKNQVPSPLIVSTKSMIIQQ
jgi:aurora kinase A